MRTMKWIAALTALSLAACAGAEDEAKNGGGDFSSSNNTSGTNNQTSDNNGPPEVEVEFGFSRPAVVGGRVFVANTDLNTVAAIDSETARITTIPVGFAPTRVVGPETDIDGGSAFVLNEGASTVTVVDSDLKTVTHDVGRNANQIAGAPNGNAAVTWYEVESGVDVPAGDLSSVNLVTPEAAYQIAVGFNVLDATFSQDGSKLLVVSADGVSVVEVMGVTEDGIAPPIPVLPPELEPQNPISRETLLAPSGDYALARVSGFAGLVLTDLATGEQWATRLPETPTDIDWVDGAQPLITANLPVRSELLVATIPDGFVAGSMLPVPGVDQPSEMDAGMSDAGMMDGGMDSGTADSGMDAGSDAGMMAPSGWLETEGFDYIELEFERLGLTEIDRTGSTALIYTSRDNDGRTVLLDLATLTQRQVPFEKGITRVESDGAGSTFVIIHDREPGNAIDSTPGSDDFILKSHGLSVLDVASGASRLTLTEQEPQQAALWAEGDQRVLYVTFAPLEPTPVDFEIEAKRALATIDLRSFALDRTLLPSLPNGLGTIPSSGKVFISQIHPQGRITFVDVLDGRLRTVTGFQLNAGID